MNFEESKAGYANLYAKMKILPSRLKEATATAKKIIANRKRYENNLGVPWWFVGIIHLRESSLRFDRYLGNGQPLNRVTTATPEGRGPFKTFEEGVIDALTVQGYANQDDWSLERTLWRFEAFNGWGYVGHGVNSPYVWAGSNLYTRGKYDVDSHYVPTLIDQQLGCAVVLNIIMGLINMATGAVNEVGKVVTGSGPEAPLPVTSVTTDQKQVFVQHLLTFIGATLVALGASHAASLYDALVNSQVFGGIIVAAAGYLLSAIGIKDANNNTLGFLDGIIVKLTELETKK